jgi:hypothetical protein
MGCMSCPSLRMSNGYVFDLSKAGGIIISACKLLSSAADLNATVFKIVFI